LFDTYLRTLLAAHAWDRLAGVLEEAIPPEEELGRLREWANMAQQVDRGDLAAKAFVKVLAQEPGDLEALRHLGLYASATAAYETAARYLGHLLSLSEGDYEVQYQYADVLLRRGEGSRARRHFERTLEMIRQSAAPTLGMRIAEAWVLEKTGHRREALTAFENLLASNPDDRNLRADYAELLIEHGLYDKAAQVLSL
jgi:tetratricopeptide (TPR) repeat protein